jgi:hypothetical protein
LRLLFCLGGDRRFQRSQELPTGISDAPTAIVPQHKSIDKNFELGCARGQPPHPVGPIRSARHQDADIARQFGNGGAPIRMARQDLQNRNLKTHGTPRDKANSTTIACATRPSIGPQRDFSTLSLTGNSKFCPRASVNRATLRSRRERSAPAAVRSPAWGAYGGLGAEPRRPRISSRPLGQQAAAPAVPRDQDGA